MTQAARYPTLLLCGMLIAAMPAAANAQDYPTRTIKVVVPFAPGGGGDIAVRMVTDGLSKRLGQAVIIENRPGPNGVAAAQSVRGADRDGYTLVTLGNVHAIGQSMMKSLPYDVVKDFAPVTSLAFADVVIATGPGSPLSSLKDVVARGKTAPTGVTIGTGIVGTTHHLTTELFKSTAGLNATIVNFRGPGDLVTAVTRGDVDVMVELIPPVLGQLESGALRPLAVSSGARFARLPSTPTFGESGVATSVTSWALMAAPAGTPDPVLSRLNADLRAVLSERDLRQKFEQMGYTAGGGTSQAARDLLVGEIGRWKQVIEAANIGRQ